MEVSNLNVPFSSQKTKNVEFAEEDNESDSDYEESEDSEFLLKYLNTEFIIKILQLIIGVICTSLYFYFLELFKNSHTTLLYSHVIFNTFIIITGVIIISYIYNHPVQDILVRIFDSLGAILYFITTAIFIHFFNIYYDKLTEDENEEEEDYYDDNEMNYKQYSYTFIPTMLLSFINMVLYILDLVLNLIRTFRDIEGDDGY